MRIDRWYCIPIGLVVYVIPNATLLYASNSKYKGNERTLNHRYTYW